MIYARMARITFNLITFANLSIVQGLQHALFSLKGAIHMNETIKATTKPTDPIAAFYSEAKSIATSYNQPKLTAEIKVEGTIFEVSGYFRASGRTITEKIFSLMSKDVDNQAVLCYAGNIPQNTRL